METWKNKIEGEIMMQDIKMTKLALISKAKSLTDDQIKSLNTSSYDLLLESLLALSLEESYWYKMTYMEKPIFFTTLNGNIILADI